MGCGLSKTVTPVTLEPEKLSKPSVTSPGKGQTSREASRRESLKQQSLKKNASLGKRTVNSSFLVQKSRSRSREDAIPELDVKASKPAAAAADTLAQPQQEQAAAAKPAVAPVATAATANPPTAAAGAAAATPLSKEQLEGATILCKAAKCVEGEVFRALRAANEPAPVSSAQSCDLAAQTALLTSSDLAKQLEALTSIRKSLAAHQPSGTAVVQAGLVPHIAHLVASSNQGIQQEAAWCLTNISSCSTEEVNAVVHAGAVQQLVKVLEAGVQSPLAEQAIWALGNIAGDSYAHQQSVLEAGIIPQLLSALQHASSSGSLGFARTVLWALANLSRPKPGSKTLLDAVPALCNIVEKDKDMECCVHAAWALAYITVDDASFLVLAEYPSALKQLVAYVQERHPLLCAPCLRTLGNLASGTATHTSLVVDNGGVKALLAIVASDKSSLSEIKEATWALSNIAAGTSDQVQALVDADAFSAITTLLHATKDAPLRKECLYVLANPWGSSVGATSDVSRALLSQPIVQELASWLSLDTPADQLIVVLEGLQDGVKKGQQIMMWAAKQVQAAIAAGSPVPPSSTPYNPVAKQLKEADGLAKLKQLSAGHADETVKAKSNGMANMLQFM